MVIPKPLREAAGLQPGSELEIGYRDGRVEIEPVRKKPRLVRKSGVLVAVPSPGSPKISTQETNRLIRDLRERRFNL